MNNSRACIQSYSNCYSTPMDKNLALRACNGVLVLRYISLGRGIAMVTIMEFAQAG